MRVLIHDYGGYPFSAQLARSLAERGHDLHYLYAGGIKTPRGRVAAEGGDAGNVTYQAVVVSGEYHRRAGIRRLAQERAYGALLGEEIKRRHPDAVISANTPLDAQSIALAATRKADGAFVHWLQDVYSLAVSNLLRRRLPGLGRLIGARFARLERRILREADAVVLIAEDFMPGMRRWGVAESGITVIENWTPLDEVTPRPKENEWAERHGLARTPVFMYAGTLGRKHDPGLFLRLADEMPQTRVVVIAEGGGADQLTATRPSRINVTVLPLPPASDLADVLGSSDVLVVILHEDASGFSVPSKVLTYLAAGRPILGSLPLGNLGARTILEANAGMVVEPGDDQGFIAAAHRMADDPEYRASAGRNAREYAERAFDIAAKTDRFETVLEAATQRAHSHRRERADTATATRES